MRKGECAEERTGGAGRGDARQGLYFFTGSEGESSGCGEQQCHDDEVKAG